MCAPWEQGKPAEVLHFIRAYNSFVRTQACWDEGLALHDFVRECKQVSLAGVFSVFSMILDVPVRMSRQLAARVYFEQMLCKASSALLETDTGQE